MKRLFLFFVAMLPIISLTTWGAAIFSTSPHPVQESSKNVKIIFDAEASGVTALKNASELYAHIGVTLTSSPSQWDYVKGGWSDNTSDKKFIKNANGLWELSIGDIRQYFGITNPEHHVAKIAVIARTADGSSQTSDNFIDVLDEGFHMSLTCDASSLVLTAPTTIQFNVATTQKADITLKVDNQEIGSVKGLAVSRL